MPAFVRMAKELNVDVVQFQRYWNFGHLTPITFALNDVALTDHPAHAEYLATLKDPVLQDPIVYMSNLSLEELSAI